VRDLFLSSLPSIPFHFASRSISMKEKRTEAKGKERKRRETKEQITLFIPYKICVFLCGCSFAFNFNEMKCKRELNANNNPQQRHTTNHSSHTAAGQGFIRFFPFFLSPFPFHYKRMKRARE